VPERHRQDRHESWSPGAGDRSPTAVLPVVLIAVVAALSVAGYGASETAVTVKASRGPAARGCLERRCGHE